jgi:hypothetical protein
MDMQNSILKKQIKNKMSDINSKKKGKDYDNKVKTTVNKEQQIIDNPNKKEEKAEIKKENTNENNNKKHERKEANEPSRDILDLTNIDIDNDTQKIIKKLYRKISKYIHPDKTNEIIKHDHFKNITESTSDGFLYKIFLTSITFKLDIEINKETEVILQNELLILQKKVNHLKKILQNIR